MAPPFKLRMQTAGAGGGSTTPGVSGGPIPSDYWGMHLAYSSSTTIWGDYDPGAAAGYISTPFPSSMGIRGWRSWDADGCSMRNIFRTDGGSPFWTRFDTAITAAKAAGVTDFILTLGGALPDWLTTPGLGQVYTFNGGIPNWHVGFNAYPPNDMAKFQTLSEAMIRRLIETHSIAPARLIVEPWNEVNDSAVGAGVVGSGFAGTMAELLDIAIAAKAAAASVSSAIRLTTPNFVKAEGIIASEPGHIALDTYLAAGGGAHADLISIHAYNDQAPWPSPEGVVEFGHIVQGIVAEAGASTKPIINTEYGFGIWRDSTGALRSAFGTTPFPDPMPLDMGAAYVTRMAVLNWIAGFKTFYFYAMEGYAYATIRMINKPATGTLLDPALAYGYVATLLAGAQVSGFQEAVSPTSEPYYSVNFSTASGRVGKILWTPDHASATVPITGAVEVRTNLGADVAPIPDDLPLTMSPQFVFFS
jgi:hypothetical protein